MNKPQSLYGQLNFTEIKEALKSGKIKAQRIQTKKGEQIVFDVNVWMHEEADQFNNNASIQCSLKEEIYKAGEKNPFYIGNLRFKAATATEATEKDIAGQVDEDDDDLPF